MTPVAEVSIGFQARLFGNDRSATEEVEFGGKKGFGAIQFRGHAGSSKWTDFGDLPILSSTLQESGLEPTMELVNRSQRPREHG